jgi:hypothetical protein
MPARFPASSLESILQQLRFEILEIVEEKAWDQEAHEVFLLPFYSSKSTIKEIPNHKVSGPIIVQCIQGKIEFTAMGDNTRITLWAVALSYARRGEPYSLKGVEDAVALLTILFTR